MTTAGLEEAGILDLCDRVLAEPGRRRHLFAWLRAPDAGPEEWLHVDAYYPAHRLVVLWREQRSAYDHIYAQQVPAHGLRLLELSPEQLGGDPDATLRQMIGALGPVSSPPPAEFAAPPRLAAERPLGYGFLLGLTLAVVLVIELYLGALRGALDHARVALAFALAIDACARTLGAVAARRAAEPGWAWGCALIGSPLVVAFWRGERATAEPAPLAGLLAVVALIALAIALVTGS